MVIGWKKDTSGTPGHGGSPTVFPKERKTEHCLRDMGYTTEYIWKHDVSPQKWRKTQKNILRNNC